MKFVYVICIAVIIFGLESAKNENDFIFWIIAGIFCAWFLKEYEKMSKNVKDLHKYGSIDDIFRKFGVPDNVHQYGSNNEFVRYTFKKSTNGWGHNKYIVDVFTTHNGQLVKHENFHE